MLWPASLLALSAAFCTSLVVLSAAFCRSWPALFACGMACSTCAGSHQLHAHDSVSAVSVLSLCLASKDKEYRMWDRQRIASAAHLCYAFSLPGNRTEMRHGSQKCWGTRHLLPNLLFCFLLSLEHGCCQALQVLGNILGANLVIHKGPATAEHPSSDNGLVAASLAAMIPFHEHWMQTPQATKPV